jgi:hypothetical protein
MPVVVQNRKTSDISHIWLIVSKATAAVLGGFVVTYWTGAAVAKTAMAWNLLSRADAGMFSGLVQLVVYVALIIWVCGTASMRKAWLVLALLTALLVGVSEFTPGPHRWRAGRTGQHVGAMAFSNIGMNGHRRHTA